MLYMNLQVSVRHQKQSGEGMLHGRDICWELLALLTPPGSALRGCGSWEKPQAAPAASSWGVSWWQMENSAHPCLAMASQPLNRSQKSLGYMLEF